MARRRSWAYQPGAAQPGYEGTPLQIVDNGRYIAKVDAVDRGRYDAANNLVHAQIIAAAPELLAAARRALMHLQIWSPSGEDDQGEIEGELEKAISKAEGRE